MPSPNPKGRPRGQTLSAELRRQADPEAIAERLLAMITEPGTGSRERLQAIALVFDRLEGRAVSRSLSLHATADALLPPHFDALDEGAKRRALDELRRRAVAGLLPEPEPTGDDDDDSH
jgi:hypothetical protein